MNPQQRPRDDRVFAANYNFQSKSNQAPSYNQVDNRTQNQPQGNVQAGKPYGQAPDQRKQVSFEMQLQPGQNVNAKHHHPTDQDDYYEQQMNEAREQAIYQQYLQQQQQQQQPQQQQYRSYEEEYPDQYDGYPRDEYENVAAQGGKPLVLHVGDKLLQFPSKMPDPNRPKPPEAPHLGEEKNTTFVKKTVCQFPNKDPDPNQKMPDSSHLGEEKDVFVKKTVCQFPSQIPDPNQKLPGPSHLGEEKKVFVKKTVLQFPTQVPDPNQILLEPSYLNEDKASLQLKQGSVCQFPSTQQDPKNKQTRFVPPEEVLQEALPVAEVEHPDHLLPSQARKQQTYITHSAHQLVKPFSDLAAPSSKRLEPVWPPTRSVIRELPKVGFNSGYTHPEGAKHFVWPPPKPEFQRNFQELPPPSSGSGPAANAWNPTTGEESTPSYRAGNISRIKPVWPPPDTKTLVKQSYSPDDETKTKRTFEFDEHMRHQVPIHIPPTYRAPPGTQFYEVQYELEE